MINKVFTILTRGKGSLRKCDPDLTLASLSPLMLALHSVLIPKNMEGLYRDLAAEQLIQCLRHSSKREWLKTFDPDSDYNHPLVFPRALSYSTDPSAPITLSNIGIASFVSYHAKLFFDFDTQAVLVSRKDNESVFRYELVGGVSKPLELTPELYFMVVNPPETGTLTSSLEVVMPYYRDLLSVVESLPAGVRDESNLAFTEQLAAAVVKLCEGCA